MEPLARLDSKSILAEDIFLEIFDQEDEIMKARMILSLTDRAAELGVKKKFEELLKAYKKVDREAKQRERSGLLSSNITSGAYEEFRDWRRAD